MRDRWLPRLAFVVACLVATVNSSASPSRTLSFLDRRLPNGLRVLIAEDHTVPVVSTAVTYNVGSRDERAGQTGVAHLFEHLMFKGSENVGPGEHFTLIYRNGGTMNATTSKDRTVYHETLPAHQLDLALFLEADRMRSLAVTQDNLQNQRSAVKEERLRRYDNQPYGRTDEALDGLAYDNFGYAHPIIGSISDLDAASLPDVVSFFHTYYAPNNAVIAIVGDVGAEEAFAKVQHSFASVPSRPSAPAADAREPRQIAERRLSLADPLAPLQRIDVAFKVPVALTPDEDALRMLSTIVGGGRSSRLYEQVVRQRQLAATVTASIGLSRGPTLFRITATAAPGRSIADLEAAIDAEVERLRTEPVPTWELDKARAGVRSAVVTSLQSSASRAILLGQFALFYGDPGVINGRDERANAVTAADVERVARIHLTSANRSVVITAAPPTGAGS